MKFTDGSWMMRPGVRAFYPQQAYEIDCSADELRVFGTREISHRGNTLDGSALSIRYFSPAPDVIGVHINHFADGYEQREGFQLYAEESVGVTVNESDTEATLTSGKLSVHVQRKGWNIDFRAEGSSLTQSGTRGIGYLEVDGEKTYVHEQLALDVGECVYGLGERFTGFVKNGQVVDVWNQDGGTGSEQAYKNIPFYLTNRGYGVFVNQPENVSFEVASERVSKVQFSVQGQSLEYFVIYGPTPKEILQKYTALTGRPALPPAWSFGLWLSTSFTTSYDEQTVTSFIEGMAERDLPLSVFHFDCFWMREFRWCDFEWDPRSFPDPQGMLQRLKARGLKICVWINPYIGQRSPLFEEGREAGYLLKRSDGKVWQTDQWQAGMGMVDFTNPAACGWYADKLRALLDMGVDAFKTDFGERIPVENVAWFDGSDAHKMHNLYTQLYNSTVFRALEEKVGVGEATLFARSATAGGQQFPVHWGGDCNSNFASMAESLRGGLSLCLSGFGFWSHDIGGFEGTPPVEIYKRWIAFGLLSTHSRLHGSDSYRVPWVFDEEAVGVLRHFTQLKYRLMPYLYAKAVEAHQTGVPVMRAMMLEFADDPACDYLDRQYMLGDSVLVAPVFSATGNVDYYVPGGTWTCYQTGEQISGPGWRRETHDFFSLPLLVRPNTVLAVAPDAQRPDFDFTQGLTLEVYNLEVGSEVSISVPHLNGSEALKAQFVRQNNTISVQVEGAEADFRILLVGIHEAEASDNFLTEQTARGLLLTPKSSTNTLTINLTAC